MELHLPQSSRTGQRWIDGRFASVSCYNTGDKMQIWNILLNSNNISKVESRASRSKVGYPARFWEPVVYEAQLSSPYGPTPPEISDRDLWVIGMVLNWTKTAKWKTGSRRMFQLLQGTTGCLFWTDSRYSNWTVRSVSELNQQQSSFTNRRRRRKGSRQSWRGCEQNVCLPPSSTVSWRHPEKRKKKWRQSEATQRQRSLSPPPAH